MREKMFESKLQKLRDKFEFTKDSHRYIYILELRPDIQTDKKALRSRVFPDGDSFPELAKAPIGFVYVGVTGLYVEDRFLVHASKGQKASKVAKLGYLSDYTSFEKCGRELTDRFGFERVSWRDKLPEKLESWVAWNLYKQGYWVWGSHLHLTKSFLGKPPFH